MLWAAVYFPTSKHVERIVVQQEDAARSVSFGRAQSADVYPFRTAMNRVQPRVAGPGEDFFWLNRPHDLWLPRVGLGVDDMDSRRAQPRDYQVTPLDMRVGRVGAQC